MFKDNKLFNYIIVIKNEQEKFINMIGLLLSAGSAFLFAKEMLDQGRWLIPHTLGIVFIAGFIVYNFFRSRKPGTTIYYSKALLIAGLVWMKMPYAEWLLFVFVALALLEYQAKLPLEIGFSGKEIVFNSLFKKRYGWEQVDNVILKDGLLTVDFKSNKIYQRLIDDGESEASEEEFNAWVKEIMRERKL